MSNNDTARLASGFCWAFPGTEPKVGLARLKEYGFEGIELWPDALAEWGASAWAQALQSTQMRCFQLCPYFNFVHGEAKIEASRVLLTEYLQAAQLLQCKRLRVFTGPPWGEGVIGAHQATPRQWAAATACLQEFCDIAAPQGVELCLECHEGSLMEDAPSALRLIKGVVRANLTTNLQLPLQGESWQTSVAALAAYTTHIHIHNWDDGLGEGALTYLGEGAFNWLPVLRALLDAGRSLCLSVEPCDHSGRHDKWETARRDGPTLRAWRAQLLGV
jgi:sugar phosphate isomerase/epimerase